MHCLTLKNAECSYFHHYLFHIVAHSLFMMNISQRSYAFERADIPVGENYVLKINYPFKVYYTV